MALRAGYKGIKKKYADPINNGQGGGGGGGSNYKKDLLYGNETITFPPSQTTSIELSKAFTEYDLLLIVGGFVSSNVKAIENWLVDATEIASLETAINNANGKIYVLPFNAGTSGGGQWVRIGQDPSDETHKTLTFIFNGEVGIYKIYGIKF